MSPVAGTPPVRAPRSVVSLVPSITEALFVLGLGGRVIGVTEWCVHPADAVLPLPKLGGTKNPDVAAIAALGPDLVIANHEENTRRVVEQLDRAGLTVWVTYPRTVREGAELLDDLAGLGASAKAVREVVAPVLAAVADAEAAVRTLEEAARARVFCPIWRDPWMAPAKDTYIHDMLELCGGRNVTADRGDGAERRYPKLTLADVEAAQPDVVLLPDEPYAFAAPDAQELMKLDIPAARSGRIHLIDGTWVSWYGPRIRPAIRRLRELLDCNPSDSPGS